MDCFTCCLRHEKKNKKQVPIAQPKDFTPPAAATPKAPAAAAAAAADHAPKHPSESDHPSAKAYTFRELATATKNFRQECLLGEGGYGKVFRGTITKTGQIVAVRQLDRNGVQPSQEFVSDVSSLSLLKHPNLVEIIGYCADGEQRILVYEYIPSGSLKNHLFDLPAGRKPLDWAARMKIALGIAEGLEFLHEKTNPCIIYRDLKSSNILLGEGNNPRLSEHGLAALVQSGSGKKHVAHSVMAGFGYGAPEYERQGEVSLKSDVYSFGVVLLEIITGRRALDTSLPTNEQQLVTWAQTFFRDPTRFPDMADPLLRKQFPVTSLNQAVGVAAMCLQEEPCARPLISDISAALSFLAMAPPEAPIPDRLVPILSSRVETFKFSSFNEGSNVGKQDRGKDKHGKKLSSDCESDSDSSDGEIVSKSKRRNCKSKKKYASRKCSRMSSRISISSGRDHSFDYNNDSSSSSDEIGSGTSESEEE